MAATAQRIATSPPRHLSYDAEIDAGTAEDLIRLRVEITELKKKLETQLDNDKLGYTAEVMQLVEGGMDAKEATWRAKASGDRDWIARARGLLRRCDVWLTKIKARLGALTSTSQASKYSAVVIPGAGTSAETVAEACNAFLQRGCWISNTLVIGTDLVIIASEPK